MNIGYITNVPYPFVKGGAEKRVYEVATRLADRGHEVTVYSRHCWDGDTEEEFAGVTHRAVADARDLYVNDRRSIYEPIEFSAQLVPVLRRHRSDHDLISCSTPTYFPVLGARLGLLGSEIPLATIWHEVWDEYWSDYLGQLGIFGRIVEHGAGRVPQHPVAVSEFTADRLAELGPARESIAVINNGIDVHHIATASPADDGFDILFVGRLTPNKQVELLLDAFEQVESGRDVTLGIIGDGPRMDALRDHAAQMEKSAQVSFLGFLDNHDEVIAHMQAATVFVSPSTREGFGITFAEAMAANCVVITTEQEYSAGHEVIEDAGFIVDHEPAALADAIDQALDGRRPPNSPREAVQKFDWERIVDQEEAFYRSILQ